MQNSQNIQSYIDHTLLKPFATESDYSQHTDEALKFGFYAVCIPPVWVTFCKNKIQNSQAQLLPQVATVVGFPLGYCETAAKVLECQEAIKNGVDEIDFVANLSWVKSQKFELVNEEFRQIRNVCKNTPLKVIIESSSLEADEIKKLCLLAVENKIDFVKTSTGFLEGGAQASDIKLMLDTLEGRARVKASGGIRNYQQAKGFIDLGVHRLGCSASIAIVQNKKTQDDSSY